MTRLELVLLFILVFVLAVGGLRLGWRNRGRRQGEIAAPPSEPADFGPDLLAPLTGLYVGSTYAGQWQNRVVVHTLGERAEAVLRLSSAGVLIQRQGSPSIFVPVADLLEARLEPALAGKVVGRGGLLVLRWQLGATDLDSGLRADDKTEYPAWVQAVNAMGAIAHVSDRGTNVDE
ncbi:MAG: hypothetical protein JWO63_2353 [Frankiales bacterium]|nr:hypothetical protein [Frankiales bacterium]